MVILSEHVFSKVVNREVWKEEQGISDQLTASVNFLWELPNLYSIKVQYLRNLIFNPFLKDYIAEISILKDFKFLYKNNP